MAADSLPPTSPPKDAVTSSAPPGDKQVTVPVSRPTKKKPSPRTPEQIARLVGRLDVALVGAVLLFAFLTAFFPVYNSDFFQQAALGRLIVQGQYLPWTGTDPLSFTSEGVYWVNHNWLYDIIVYAIYQIPQIGGIVLVVLKALMLTLLAELMLRIARRPGASLWVPALCVALAVLTMSPRVFLQPACVSFFFVGVTLWLLQRPRSTGGHPLRSWGWLPPLFLLWVNLDDWFVLGPVTVALYLAGEWMERRVTRNPSETSTPEQLRTLALVLGTAILACLINPYHVWTFTIPPQLGLSPVAGTVQDDPAFRTFFLSPFGPNYFQPRAGLTVAGMAYFPLLGLGVLSFALAWPKVRGWRVAIWLGFALLSVWHARAIPFFAVVAGPITALNCLDFADRRGALSPQAAVGGRWASLLVALALLVATIPGWMQTEPYRMRHIGWGVNPDPSLERLAQRICHKIDDHELKPDLHWFNTSSEAANYLAWYCPGQKTFYDQRLVPAVEAAKEFVDVRRSLGAADDDSNAPHRAWPDVFNKYDIHYVLHQEGDRLRPSTALQRILSRPEEWGQLVGLFPVGGACAFGWQDPAKPERRFDPRGLPLTKLAFGTDCEAAPLTRAPQDPRRHEWWEGLWRVDSSRPVEAIDGQMYLNLYDQLKLRRDRVFYDQWTRLQRQPWVVGMVVGPLPLTTYVRMTIPERPEFLRLQEDDAPPAPLYLALRATRRALHDHPDDARTWLQIARIYKTLHHGTRERVFAPSELHLIRQTQMLAALHRAIDLDPDLGEAHLMLAEVYGGTLLQYVLGPRDPRAGRPRRQFIANSRYLDLSLKHMRELQRIHSLRGRQATDSEETFNKQAKAFADQIGRLEDELEKRKKDYRIRSEGGHISVIDKAALARALGLAETALEELDRARSQDLTEQTEQGTIGVGGVLKLELMLDMGRLEQVRELLALEGTAREDLRRGLGLYFEVDMPAYDWLRLLLTAAEGDYQEADKLLGGALDDLRGPRAVRTRQEFAFQVVRNLFPAPFPDTMVVSGLGAMGLPVRLWSVTSMHGHDYSVRLRLREAELLTLRGWLALEVGAVEDAQRYLSDALALASPGERLLIPVTALFGTPALRFNLASRFEYRGRGLAQIGVDWLRAARQ
jgi:hypothetical protein